MKITIKKSELYKNAIETVIKNYSDTDNAFEVLRQLYSDYRLEESSEAREEENNG